MSRLNARYHLEAIVIDSGLPAKAKTPARDFALIFLFRNRKLHVLFEESHQLHAAIGVVRELGVG